jgi:hypothetical protein
MRTLYGKDGARFLVVSDDNGKFDPSLTKSLTAPSSTPQEATNPQG